MSRSVLYSKRIEALQLVSIPATVIMLIALSLLIGHDNTLRYSLVMGGLVWLIPNLYFAIKVFSTSGKNIAPQQLLINFYLAEVTKLVLCAIIFIIVVKYLPVAILPLLGGYCIAQFTFWMSPFLLNKARRLVK